MAATEEKVIPMLILISIVFDVISLCTRNWMQGYYGDVTVLELCPWRLCHLDCLRCMDEAPHMDCFWMQDWSDTGFESFGVVAHLEYWCLALLAISLVTAIVSCVDVVLQKRQCVIACSRPTLVVLTISCLLSTSSVSLFGTKLIQGTTGITTFRNVTVYFGWPFYVRICGAITAWTATIIAFCNQCRSAVLFDDSDERVMVVTSTRDMHIVDDSPDEAENGALL